MGSQRGGRGSGRKRLVFKCKVEAENWIRGVPDAEKNIDSFPHRLHYRMSHNECVCVCAVCLLLFSCFLFTFFLSSHPPNLTTGDSIFSRSSHTLPPLEKVPTPRSVSCFFRVNFFHFVYFSETVSRHLLKSFSQ